jgi:hypothetical protein
MRLALLTLIHAAITLITIGAGTRVLYGLLNKKLLRNWVVTFLRCTLAMSVAGLLFPFDRLQPIHWLSMLSVYMAGVATLALCKFHLAGFWRSMFAFSTPVILGFDVLVALSQMFKLITPFRELAPTQSEPSYLATQLVVIVLFLCLAISAVNRFRVEPPQSI